MEGIRNVAGILKQHAGRKIVVVISASGKTTNHLEVVMNAHLIKTDGIEAALVVVKDHHKMLMDGLFSPHDAIYDEVAALYSEISWITAHHHEVRITTLYMIQLVGLGNCYPRIVALIPHELPTQWIDFRSIWDRRYVSGIADDWDVTQENIDIRQAEFLEQGAFIANTGIYRKYG